MQKIFSLLTIPLFISLYACNYWSSTSNPNAISGDTVTALTVGAAHSCALYSSGEVKCWGGNLFGGLGIGNTTSVGNVGGQMGANLIAVDLGTGKTAKLIESGAYFTCAILNDDSVKCWGFNGEGQLGLGDTDHRGDAPGEMGDFLPTVNLGTARTAKALAAGYHYMCAILDDDRVKCWGQNNSGQLGLGDFSSRGDGPGEMGDSLSFLDLGAIDTVSSIAAGGYHVCAILSDDSLKCWGDNASGQLGYGDMSTRGDGPGEMGLALAAVDLGPAIVATQINASFGSTCAITNASGLKCWGRNDFGQLGYEDSTSRGDGPGEMGAALVNVNLGTGVLPLQIVGKDLNHCVVLDDETVKCWGRNAPGNLGQGDTLILGDDPSEMGNNLLSVDLGSDMTVINKIAGSGEHICALSNEANVKCWGANTSGQLGLGDTANRGDDLGEMGDDLALVEL